MRVPLRGASVLRAHSAPARSVSMVPSASGVMRPAVIALRSLWTSHKSTAHLRCQDNHFCYIESRHLRRGIFLHPELR